jgi:serine/threonine-protein kinase RsbW
VIQESASVRLQLENRPENVAVVRAAIAGLADAAEFDEELGTDLKTAISEACNNVVIHAYEGGRGLMRVAVKYERDQVEATITDAGTGIKRLSSPADHMGLGLALISALADQAEFQTLPEGGTQVRMRFRRSEDASQDGSLTDTDWPDRPPEISGDVVLWCQPVSLSRHLLGRVARAVAATSHFTISGVADLYKVNDAFAEYAESAANEQVVLAITGSSHRLAVDAGPFMALRPEGAQDGTIVEFGDGDGAEIPAAAPLAELVDQLSFQERDSHRLLHLLLLDSGRAPTD